MPNGRLLISASVFISVFRILSRDLFGTCVKRPYGTFKNPTTFRRNNRQSVFHITKREQMGPNGNKSPFHSVTLLALGCCTRRLSRKEKKIKSARSPPEKQAFPLDCMETRVSEGQTGSSHTRRKCLDLHRVKTGGKNQDLHIFRRNVFKNWQTNCSCLRTGQSILMVGWRSRWGPTEEIPRNTASGPRTSPSLQETQELDTGYKSRSKPVTTPPSGNSPMKL